MRAPPPKSPCKKSVFRLAPTPCDSREASAHAPPRHEVTLDDCGAGPASHGLQQRLHAACSSPASLWRVVRHAPRGATEPRAACRHYTRSEPGNRVRRRVGSRDVDLGSLCRERGEQDRREGPIAPPSPPRRCLPIDAPPPLAWHRPPQLKLNLNLNLDHQLSMGLPGRAWRPSPLLFQRGGPRRRTALLQCTRGHLR